MSNPRERRAHRRVPVEVTLEQDRDHNYCLAISLGRRLNVLLELDERSDHNFYTGLTNDISEGGLFIATSAILPVGTDVVLSIQLPCSPDAHRAEGVVRWVREPEVCFGGAVSGYGVEFRALTPEVLAAIRAYVARHETIFFEAA